MSFAPCPPTVLRRRTNSLLTVLKGKGLQSDFYSLYSHDEKTKLSFFDVRVCGEVNKVIRRELHLPRCNFWSQGNPACGGITSWSIAASCSSDSPAPS